MMTRPRQTHLTLLLLALGIAGCLVVGSGLALWLWPAPPTPSHPTAVLTLIARPTLATPPAGSPGVQGGPTPPPTGAAALAVGVQVQVQGTGGDGLRVRVAPGLDAQVRFLAQEGEVFQVVQGPQEADGYRWWRLVSPRDPARAGWAVADYLRPLPPTPQP